MGYPSELAATVGRMLSELRVENLLLIERAELRLGPGLNVLTGETGAGKTVLAGALDLLLGGRSRSGIVRPGAAEAYVEGVFDLPESLPAEFCDRLPADATEVVLARRVGSDGRTRAYLNGRTATVAELRDLGSALVSFYGQHEHRKLTLAAAQLQILDGLCGPEQRLRLRGAAEALTPESSELPGASQLLAGAASRLDALAGVDPRLDVLAERLRGLFIESEDLAAEFRLYGEQAQGAEIAGESRSLEQIEERLTVIERLARKHGGSVQAVLDHALSARTRREELAGAEVACAHAEQDLARARAELEAHVLALRSARAGAAPRLARSVRKQLASLAMAGATFEVTLSERQPGPAGGDGVEFMIAPNPGVPAGPLREIASGGELSRVMLAIMSAATAPSPHSTLVFDEVDAGIGGHTARAVGARLRQLGEGTQVLCITHLPQIASLGERHFTIVKDTSARTTRAEVLQLGESEVVSELVRMLGAAEADSAARRHARDLRRAA